MNAFVSRISHKSFALHLRKKHIIRSSVKPFIYRRKQRFRKNLSPKRKSEGSKVSARKLASRLQKLPSKGESSVAGHFSYQMESTTKWDMESLKTHHSVEPYEKFQDISLVPHLQVELWKAQSRIKELEAENTDLLVNCLKEKLNKERNKKKRAKAVNSKLKKKLLGMESTANRLRRERDTMENVCEELATRIDELKVKTSRIREENEEERRMFHIAKMWREERVRDSLTEAKLALQEKYEEMNLLVEELEKCLERVKELEGSEEIRFRRSEYLIQRAKNMEIAENKIDFERFEFFSDEDN